MALKNFKLTLAGEDLGMFYQNALTLNDSFVMQNNTGMTINEMLAGLSDVTNPAPNRALVWFMRYKQGKTVDLLSIDYKLTEFEIEAIPDPKAPASPRKPRSTSASSDTSSA